MYEINPEKNHVFRAFIYLIGFGGILHLATLLIVALEKHNFIWFNPLFAVDLEKIFPGTINNPLTFFGGWALFASGGFVIYKVIRRG